MSARAVTDGVINHIQLMWSKASSSCREDTGFVAGMIQYMMHVDVGGLVGQYEG